MDDYIKRLLVPRNLGYEKIRIGPNSDGGYVVSKQHLQQTSIVYSLGIGDNCDFDCDLADRGLTIYQFDGSIKEPPKYNKNFIFNELKITAKTFSEYFVVNKHLTEKNILLKMDIEGGEFEFFRNIDWKILDCFNQIVFELHVKKESDAYTAKLLQKLSCQFVLIHIHAHEGHPPKVKWNHETDIPDYLELTYVNNTCIPVESASPIFGLDFPNRVGSSEVKLNWWL